MGAATRTRPRLEGIWLPIITPFRADKIDWASYRKLIDHYVAQGIEGLIPAGTTGESPVLSEAEYEELAAKTVEYTAGRVPIYFGCGGNYTKKVIHQLQMLEKHKVQGVLSVCPYYSRPDQRGIYEHFKALSEATSLPLLIYNIPYRTGRNIENETLRRLAELPNVVGLKDSCGDLRQTSELILHPPKDFSILTGEDALFYTTLALGGAGGILAAAHLFLAPFREVYEAMKANDHEKALAAWRKVADYVPLLFQEPNPAPIKYWLRKQGLIASAEVRLPLVGITTELAAKMDAIKS